MLEIQSIKNLKEKIGKVRNKNKTSSKPKLSLENLAPNSNVDNKTYEEALDYAMKDNDILNIAISGSYGAGKSSHVNTYFKNKKYKLIKISFAKFESNSSFGIDQEDYKGELASKIINQIIHQVNPDKIKDLGFPIIREFGCRSLYVVMCFFSIILTIIHKYYDFLQDEGYILDCLNSHKSLFIFISGFVNLSIIFFIVLKIYTYIWKKGFSKINIKGNGIELFRNEEVSQFDRYLAEIIKIFEKEKIEIVIFEDIDRYKDVIIFERLREINTLINIKLKSKTKFVYLVRDDLLEPRDRVKFFDLVIPIIPCVDSWNAYSKFKLSMAEYNIDDNFLFEVSQYLDDMRMIKNVINEFRITKAKLNNELLDDNKLLSIMIYKNLFPYDYNHLQFDEGYIHELFLSKEDIIAKELIIVNEKINKIESEIDDVAAILAENLEELDYIKKGIENSTKSVYFKRNWLENEYPKKVKILKEGQTSCKNRKQIELSQLYGEKNAIESYSLSQLLQSDNRDNYLTILNIDSKNEDIKSMVTKVLESHFYPAIKYLLVNGYINESYPDYMTYFYENIYSREDKEYHMAVADRKPLDYDFKLKSPKTIISRMRDEYFKTLSILNCDIIEELIKDEENNKERINSVFYVIDKYKKYDFFEKYFQRKNDTFINFACCYNKTVDDPFYKFIMYDDTIDTECKRTYLQISISLSSTIIKESERKEWLVDYINSKSDILKTNELIEIDKLFIGLKELGIELDVLDFNESNEELYKKIYKEGLYSLNKNNLIDIFEHILKIDNSSMLHKNYSSLPNTNEPIYSNKIQNDFNKYLDIVFEICEDKIYDDEDDAINILNKEEIDFSLKEKYISLYKNNFGNISDIKDEKLWDKVLEHDCLSHKEVNLIKIYEYKKQLDISLIDFINKKSFRFENSYNNCSEEKLYTISNLCIDVIKSNSINDDKCIKIVKGYKYKIDDERLINTISVDRLLNLLEDGLVNEKQLILALSIVMPKITNKEQFIEICRTNENNELQTIFEENRINIIKGEKYIDNLLEGCKNKGWISDYYIENDKYMVKNI